ncbi:carcinine transporter-like [Epargyreus clarus]|uniref:carcinine transporter-like n=1 Tax=Epargyreus clarus TaxID=520877 RepID=UPI003C2EB809
MNSNISKERKAESQNIENKELSSVLETVIKHVGDMGLYQRLLFVGTMPFGLAWAFIYLVQMFLTATPQEHWCRVPDLEGLSVELRRFLSIPGAAEGKYDRCAMYDANWTEVLATMMPPDPGTPTVPCQNGWEFLFDDIPYATVVSEREWVCDKAYLIPWAQTINFFGAIVGGFLCGTLADKYGRVPALVVANILGCVGGVATIYTTTFWDFCLCRFISGMSCDSCFLMMYILVLEYVGTQHRTWVANMSVALYFGGGSVMLPWITLWISDWRKLMYIISLPMLVVLLTPFLVPESARWLVTKGRIDEAVKILRRFEKVNRTKIPDEVMNEFVVIAENTKEDEQSIFVVFKTPSLSIIVILLVLSFMAVALVFDGLVRLSESLGMDFFITFTMTSATEAPAVGLLVFMLDRFGRRWLVCLPMIVAGILAFVGAFVPRGVFSVVLAVSARFFNNMSYATIIQWTPELMATPLRASGASFVHISAYAAKMISPFVVYSDRAWEGLSLILIALVAVLGGSVALLLPETMGKRMPQTMEDWLELAKSRFRFGRKEKVQHKTKE